MAKTEIKKSNEPDENLKCDNNLKNLKSLLSKLKDKSDRYLEDENEFNEKYNEHVLSKIKYRKMLREASRKTHFSKQVNYFYKFHYTHYTLPKSIIIP